MPSANPLADLGDDALSSSRSKTATVVDFRREQHQRQQWPGSLRRGSTLAQSGDVIDFKFPPPTRLHPGGPFWTIDLASALPAISVPLTIDATSQPGYSATPVIELNGAERVARVERARGCGQRHDGRGP